MSVSQGVNISGGEFNQKWVPARYNWDYVYPSQSDIDFFSSTGMTCIRDAILVGQNAIQLKMERLIQPNWRGSMLW